MWFRRGLKIKCSSNEEAEDLTGALSRNGWKTEIIYFNDGIEGIWVELKEREKDRIDPATILGGIMGGIVGYIILYFLLRLI